MAKPKLNRKRVLAWRVIAAVVLTGVAIYVLAAHGPAVRASLDVARHARDAWLILAVALLIATFCLGAAIYGLLALHPLRYTETLLVQIAAAFTGRLLPAGLGGLGLNGVYLYRRRHTPAEATAIVSVNNLVGIAAHLLLLAAVFALDPHAVRPLLERYHLHVSWGIAVGFAAILVVIGLVPVIRRRLAHFGRNLLTSLGRERPGRLIAALFLASLVTACYTLLLLSAARAVGVSLGLLQLFIVFSAGMLVGTAAPTPGGLVGAETGLFAGFIACGVSSAQAGAAVLLFRLATYWLVLIPGAVALLAARKYKLV